MFFTKAAFVIAWLVFLPSAAFYAVFTVAAVTGNMPAVVEMWGSWFAASSSTFVQGIAVGVAFGIAAEISRNVAAKS